MFLHTDLADLVRDGQLCIGCYVPTYDQINSIVPTAKIHRLEFDHFVVDVEKPSDREAIGKRSSVGRVY